MSAADGIGNGERDAHLRPSRHRLLLRNPQVRGEEVGRRERTLITGEAAIGWKGDRKDNPQHGDHDQHLQQRKPIPVTASPPPIAH